MPRPILTPALARALGAYRAARLALMGNSLKKPASDERRGLSAEDRAALARRQGPARLHALGGKDRDGREDRK